jgi:hypothetical protein
VKKIITMSKSEFLIDRESRMIELQRLSRSELIRLLAIQTVRANSAEAHYKELNHQMKFLLPSLIDGTDKKTRKIIKNSDAEILEGLNSVIRLSDEIIAQREVFSAVQSKKNVAAKANAARNDNINKTKNEVKKHWLKWKDTKKKFAKTDFAKSMIQVKKFDLKERTITESWCKEWETEWQLSQ